MADYNDLYLSGKTILSPFVRLMKARNTLDLRTTWAPVTDKLRPLIPLMPGVVTINSWTKGVPRILLRNSQKSRNRSLSPSTPTHPWKHCLLP